MTGTRADRTSSTWTSSEFAPVMTGHETSSPFYSHDGTTLVFSMFDDIKSSWDLYMVERPCN